MTNRGGRLLLLSIGLAALIGLAFGASAVAGSSSKGAHASQSVPDLTGAWHNEADSSGLDWQFTASNSLQMLNVTWSGSGAHSSLMGTSTPSPGAQPGPLSLSQSGGTTRYGGGFKIDEQSVHVTGTMTVTVLSANEVQIDLTPTNGAKQTYRFKRVGGSTTPSVTPVAVATAPTAAAFDQTVSAAAPPPGDAIQEQSPPVGNATAVTATETGLTAQDVVDFLVAQRNKCVYTFFGTVTAIGMSTAENSAANAELRASYISEATAQLVACTAFFDAALEAATGARASLHPAASAAAGCSNLGVRLVLKGKGRSTKITGVHKGAGGVRVSCKAVAGGVAVTYKSSKPLRTVAGSRLHVAVVRSRHDAPGGRIGFTFHKG